MMKVRNACTIAAVLGLLAGCGSGGATGPGSEGARSARSDNGAPGRGAAPSAAVTEEDAERCLVRGRAEIAAKRWDEAERRLEMAWRADGRAEIAADLGRVEAELGKIGEAAAHLSAALDGGIGDVEARLAELRPRLGSVALRPPSAGAEVAVFVDGWRATHRLPRAELWLAPGEHEVEMRVGARIVARKSIDVQVGQRVEWDASVDGKIDGEVLAKGDIDGSLDPNLNANLDPNLNANVSSATSSLSTPLLVVGGIVGSLAVGFGTGLAVAASNLSADAGKLEADLKADTGLEFPCQGENKPAECALLEAKLADEELFLGVGVPLLVTAGLVVGGGIAYIVWPRAKAPDPKVEICGVTVRPGVGPGSFSLTGTF